jgi:hypothetical protein
MFVTRMISERPDENVPVMMTAALPDYHLLRPNVVAIPLRLAPTVHSDQRDLLAQVHWRANLSDIARDY